MGPIKCVSITNHLHATVNHNIRFGIVVYSHISQINPVNVSYKMDLIRKLGERHLG